MTYLQFKPISVHRNKLRKVESWSIRHKVLKVRFYKATCLEIIEITASQDFSPLKAGIFSLAVGVGHVVTAWVIGSGCLGFGSNPVCHAAFATNKTAPAGRNICMFSSQNGKGQGVSLSRLRRNHTHQNNRICWTLSFFLEM